MNDKATRRFLTQNFPLDMYYIKRQILIDSIAREQNGSNKVLNCIIDKVFVLHLTYKLHSSLFNSGC